MTSSRSFFLALDAGALEAAMAILSPVCGLRPGRAGRERVENVPKPAMATASSLVRASPMTAKTVLSARSAAALGSAACVATWVTRSAFDQARPEARGRGDTHCQPPIALLRQATPAPRRMGGASSSVRLRGARCRASVRAGPGTGGAAE